MCCLEVPQEKGVLAKGVSAQSSVTPKKPKIPKDMVPSSTFSAESATAKRAVHFCKQKKPSKIPLVLGLDHDTSADVHQISGRKWPRSLFRPVQARSWKERSGTGWDQDGPGWPHLGTWMGPKYCKTKHMANLDGTPLGPWMGPGRSQDRTQARVWIAPPEAVTDF